MPRHFRSHRQDEAEERATGRLRWITLALCAMVVAGVWTLAFWSL